MTATMPATGVDRFVAQLALHGLKPQQHGGLIVYTVTPLNGVAAGRDVETGVEISELAGWPMTGPHWIHVPNALTIPGGSQQASEHAQWSKYSRPHPGRLDASSAPERAWVAHVRALLGTAA
jgi:hypothetical protein